MRYLTRILIFAAFLLNVSPQVRFKKIVCNSTDPITVFERCEIGLVNKSITAITVHQKILQPIYSVYLNISVLQQSNSMNRVLYRFNNIDACSFLINRRNPVLKLLFLNFQKFSNVNHSCPYKDYLLVNDLVIIDPKLFNFPFLSGDYELHLIWQLNGKNASRVSVHFHFTRK